MNIFIFKDLYIYFYIYIWVKEELNLQNLNRLKIVREEKEW